MATQVASLYGLLALDDREFTRGLNNADKGMDTLANKIDRFGAQVSGVGVQLTAITQPLRDFGKDAITSSLEFSKSMANTQSVLGLSSQEMAGLSDEIAMLGANSIFGSNAAAETFYDIAGGVVDASSRMAILQASMDTAEAGAADLGATTSALISVMNSYSYGADQATFASDVLTRTVGMGVGSMEEFASALPKATSLAASLDVSLENVAGSAAYMTTKGFTASESTTRLTAVMTALLKPNDKMKAALAAAGLESGSTALKMYGLAGTLGRLDRAMGGSSDAMSEALGSTEALQAAVILNQAEFEDFYSTFVDGINGSTDAAKAIQLDAPASKFALLNSQVELLRNEIGDALIPVLLRIGGVIMPIVQQLIAWINQNPELTSTIVMVLGAAAALGPVLVAIGTAISGVGSVVGALGAAFSFIISPIGLAIGAAAALAAAYLTNFGGIRDFIDTQVRPRIEDFFGFLGQVWAQVQPALQQLYNWFVSEGLPAISTFVTGTVLPAIQDFFNFIGGVWAVVQPALEQIFTWFMTEGLPAIDTFITGTVQPNVEKFFNFIQGVWTLVQPGLSELGRWFTETGLPAIQTGLQAAMDNVITPFINLLKGIWDTIKPGFDALADGVSAVLGPILTVINDIINSIAEIGRTSNAVMGGGLNDNARAQLAARVPSKDSGGMGAAGQPYYIGTGAQPELFVPQTAGMFYPAGKQGGGGMGNVTIQAIYANSYDEGRAAARGFEDEFEAIRRKQG